MESSHEVIKVYRKYFVNINAQNKDDLSVNTSIQ